MSPTERLELYCARVDDLRRCRAIAEGGTVGLTLRFEAMKGVCFSRRGPDPEALDSLLRRFRPMFLRNDPAHAGRIYNLCETSLQNDTVRGWLRESRQYWKQALRNSGLLLVVDEQTITPEEAVNVWLNGWYFHSDEAKLARLRAMGAVSQFVSHYQFVECVLATSRQLIYLGNVVRVGLRDRTFRFRDS